VPELREALRVGAELPRRLGEEHGLVGRGPIVDQRAEEIEDDGPRIHLARMHVRRIRAPLL
jgi:hypothetical protein